MRTIVDALEDAGWTSSADGWTWTPPGGAGPRPDPVSGPVSAAVFALDSLRARLAAAERERDEALSRAARLEEENARLRMALRALVNAADAAEPGLLATAEAGALLHELGA
jgi:hypothetical protein